MRHSLSLLLLLASPLVLAQNRIAWDPGAPSFTAAVPNADFSVEIVVADLDADGGINLPLVYEGRRLAVELRGATDTLTIAPETVGTYHIEVTGMPDGAVFDLNFSSPSEARFSDTFRETHAGTSRMEIPEVYELVNVVFALTPSGRDTTNGLVLQRGSYHQAVLDHFGAYSDHPAVAALEAVIQDSWFVGVRSNALAYRFDSDALVGDSAYVSLGRGKEDLADAIPALEDFAETSGFRDFYARYATEYAEQVQAMESLVPVPQMWTWLEAEFPERSQSYRTVFSPLTGGTHNAKWLQDGDYRETIIYIAGPGLLDGDVLVLSHDLPGWRELELSRIAFTEFDHAYVNPAMAPFEAEISQSFSDLETWNGSGDYASASETFAEYMTWAAFLLYVDDHYSAAQATATRAGVTRFMEQGRGFWRFRAFLEATTILYQSRAAGETLASLMPRVIRWVSHQ